MSRRAAVLATLLGLSLALPLSYYACRSDPYDERFAWRMFSSTRLARCSLEIRSGGRVVPLAKEFHVAWIRTARRGRMNVVDAMARHVCGLERWGPPVTFALSCRHVDGRTDIRSAHESDVCP